ncbi:MAG: alpha-E domain-containing protein [Betaproteobacteria bacterium]|nr:alpha-E domain-containing protein [Betaproteobacteria bacterium]
MLSRVANNLFWMSRHIERAENTARLLDVTYRMSLLPYRILEPGQSWAEPWALPLVINGLATAYYERYPGALGPDDVLRFMVFDAANPSSIYACIHTARENARVVRGAITSEMYEDINAFWLELRNRDYAGIRTGGLSEFFDWVKMRSHQFRGVTFGTSLRDEGYSFTRLGTFIERADNTARLLDVKYHTLLPSVADVGGAVDYYQWGALLRSLSAFDAYRKVYRDVIMPRRVAELLILRDDVPRSLHACMNEIYEILRDICESSSREVERLAGELHAQLYYGRTEQIISLGLHEYLMGFLEKLGALNDEINRHFLVPVYPQQQAATARR